MRTLFRFYIICGMMSMELPNDITMALLNQLDSTQQLCATAASRRVPVQSRSQHTVQRVLDAASALLGQMPLEDLTTTRIAAEAGLSIGASVPILP